MGILFLFYLKKDLKSSIVKSYLRIPSKIDFVNNESFELDYSTLSFIYLKPSLNDKTMLETSVLDRINFFITNSGI